MDGLYILDGHLITNGNKTALVTPTERSMAGYHGLVIKTDDGAKMTGIVKVGEPQSVSINDFDDRFDEHRISSDERMRWWGNKEQLFLHKVLWYEQCEPVQISLPPGTNMRVVLDQSFHPFAILSKTATDSGWLYECVEV